MFTKNVVPLIFISLYTLSLASILFFIGAFTYLRYISFFEIFSACGLILVFYWTFSKSKQGKKSTIIVGLATIILLFVANIPAIFHHQYMEFTNAITITLGILYVFYQVVFLFVSSLFLYFSLSVFIKKKEPFDLLMSILNLSIYKVKESQPQTRFRESDDTL
ncbi:hypothetical protein [Dictyobacter alpinus]|uniref:hypothetical protein n=1 Tax=Dictyobacter alpinus TaxID=2014873 RepID=UPI000F844244|nr:hypothetical protein [Dictyobacter alpinus]